MTAATSVLRSGLPRRRWRPGRWPCRRRSPSPEVGTPAQPGPNGASAAIGSSDSIGARTPPGGLGAGLAWWARRRCRCRCRCHRRPGPWTRSAPGRRGRSGAEHGVHGTAFRLELAWAGGPLSEVFGGPGRMGDSAKNFGQSLEQTWRRTTGQATSDEISWMPLEPSGKGRIADVGLHVAVLVGGAAGDEVPARLGVPLEVPLAPVVVVGLRARAWRAARGRRRCGPRPCRCRRPGPRRRRR